MAAAAVVAVDPPRVSLEFPDDATVMREGVERQRAAVEAVLAERVGQPVALVLVGPAAMAPEAAPQARRLSGEAMKAEKLARFRKTDPALDLAANELDLEVVDDSPKGF